MSDLRDPRAADQPRILFVCQLNAVRSPIAEGLAKAKGLDAQSCGLAPDTPDPVAIAIMSEIGIDISERTPKSLAEFQDDEFAHIICFSEDAASSAKAVFGEEANVEFWRVPNPGIGSHDVRAAMETYRAIRTVIQTRLARLARLSP